LVPARQILKGDVYLHQTQLDPKAAFTGDVWDWHQDFLYWKKDDGMPKPDVITVCVFLSDITDFNGPIFLVPGSHHSLLEVERRPNSRGWQSTLTAKFSYVALRDKVADLVTNNGMVAATGRKGSVLMFHGQTLHCSLPNLSPFERTVLLIRYNAIGNELNPVQRPRPTWLANRNPTPLNPV
jgi:ectoine hydroxylase